MNNAHQHLYLDAAVIFHLGNLMDVEHELLLMTLILLHSSIWCHWIIRWQDNESLWGEQLGCKYPSPFDSAYRDGWLGVQHRHVNPCSQSAVQHGSGSPARIQLRRMVFSDVHLLSGVLVLAATNRPHVLDAALMRPGRLDLQLHVPAPDASGRHAILQVHTRDMPLASDVDLKVTCLCVLVLQYQVQIHVPSGPLCVRQDLCDGRLMPAGSGRAYRRLHRCRSGQRVSGGGPYSPQNGHAVSRAHTEGTF